MSMRKAVSKINKRVKEVSVIAPKPMNESIRHAADIVTKWGEMMAERWMAIQVLLENFDVKTPDTLELGKYGILRAHATSPLLILVNNTWSIAADAVQSPFLDPAALPSIRVATLDALADLEAKIEAARAILNGGVPDVLPRRARASENIIDEFGADILQYENTSEVQLKDGTIFKSSSLAVHGKIDPEDLNFQDSKPGSFMMARYYKKKGSP